MTAELLLSFPESTAAERTRLATTLQETLRHVSGVDQATVLRERDDTMDAGTIVSLVLSAPAIVMAVKALQGWIVRSNQTKIDLDHKLPSEYFHSTANFRGGLGL
jgi:hypothetical protein